MEEKRPLSKLEDTEFLESQDTISKILSMTNDVISQGSFGVAQLKAMPVQKASQNTLWDSLQGTVKKEEEIEEKNNILDQDQVKLQKIIEDMSDEEKEEVHQESDE